jgi:hypothetical protein
MKDLNLRHYESKHSKTYSNFTGQLRKDKVNDLKNKLTNQQNLFKTASKNSESVVKASFEISKILTKHLKPFADGELVKECLMVVADILFPDKKQLVSQISLSRMTIGRRVEDMSTYIESPNSSGYRSRWTKLLTFQIQLNLLLYEVLIQISKSLKSYKFGSYEGHNVLA